jgi:hypothetical protein
MVAGDIDAALLVVSGGATADEGDEGDEGGAVTTLGGVVRTCSAIDTEWRSTRGATRFCV